MAVGNWALFVTKVVIRIFCTGMAVLGAPFTFGTQVLISTARLVEAKHIGNHRRPNY